MSDSGLFLVGCVTAQLRGASPSQRAELSGNAEHPTTCSVGTQRGSGLLIRSDCRGFIRAEGSARSCSARSCASQHAAAPGLLPSLGPNHPSPPCPTLPSRSCLCRSQERSVCSQRGEGQKGWERASKAHPCLLSAEKQLIGCKVSTLPGRSLFLPFRVPPAFLLQCLGSCDCSTPLTPRLLWKPMNCLRKVSWQPAARSACSPAGLGQCRSPLCRQRPSLTSSPCCLTCFLVTSLLAHPHPSPSTRKEWSGVPSQAENSCSATHWGCPIPGDVNPGNVHPGWASCRTDLPSK